MFDIKKLKRYDVLPRTVGKGDRTKETKDGRWVKFSDIEEMMKPPVQNRKIFPGMRGLLEPGKLSYTRDLD